MRAAVLAAVLLLAGAASGAEVLEVRSETGGMWRPARFSPIRVRVRVPAGSHEIRARLEPGKVVVAPLESAGGEESVRLSLLPERDATTVEIDAGDGWKRHDLSLRKKTGDRPVIGIPEEFADHPGLADLRARIPRIEIRLPPGDPAPTVRDTCDLVLTERLLTGEPPFRWTAAQDLPGDALARWLDAYASGAELAPVTIRSRMAPLAVGTALVLALAWFGRRRGWTGWRLVALAAGLQAALLGVAWVASGDAAPRVVARGVSVVGPRGGRTDLLALESRGEETLDLRAPGRALLRPLADALGRIGPYELRDASELRSVSLGRGRRARIRIDHPPGPAPTHLLDRFLATSDEVTWGGDGPAELVFDPADPNILGPLPWSALWNRFRPGGSTSPIGPRGRFLRRVLRPAVHTGLYGSLAEPPPLDANVLGVERVELLFGVLAPASLSPVPR